MRTIEQITIGLVEEICRNIEPDEIFRKKLPYREHWLGLIKNAIEISVNDMRERAAKEAEKGPLWLEVYGNTMTWHPDETKGLTLEARIRALSLS